MIFIVGLAVFALLPRDSISSAYNVWRVQAGDYRPLMLLFRAPTPVESLTEYVALLDHRDPLVAEGMAAYLCERHEALRPQYENAQRADWREYQMAFDRALRITTAAADADRLQYDEDALTEMAKACNGYDAATDGPNAAWRTGQSSDLEWIDD